MLVLERLEADERYRNLSATDQHLLAFAVRNYMGGHGWWWHKRKTWATDANTSTKTVTRATDHYEAVGLVAKTEYHRPPGGSHGGLNGSLNYRLDPTIVGEALLRVPVPSAKARAARGDKESPRVEHADDATRRDTESPRGGAHTQGQEVPAEPDLSSEPRQPAARAQARAHNSPHPPAALLMLLTGLNLDERGIHEMHEHWRRKPEGVEDAVDRAWEKFDRGNVDNVGGLAISIARAECAV